MNLLAFLTMIQKNNSLQSLQKIKDNKPMKILLFMASCLLLSCSKSTSYQFPHPTDQRFVVVNYWAAWCPPCRHEIPELNNLMKNHSDKIVVYGINFDELQGAALQIDVKKLNIEFEQLSPPYTTQFEPLKISTLPATLIINHQGKLVEQLTGVQTEKAILNRIQQYQ